jgi:hypothetical protein
MFAMFIVLAGCLLGFVALVFGLRAARWTLAFLLLLPLLFFAAGFPGIKTANHPPPGVTDYSGLLDPGK